MQVEIEDGNVGLTLDARERIQARTTTRDGRPASAATLVRWQLEFTVATSVGGSIFVRMGVWALPRYSELNVGRLVVENINQRDLRVTSHFVGPSYFRRDSIDPSGPDGIIGKIDSRMFR